MNQATAAANDRSKCAPGGLLQENITYQSPPCMPKFVGDNGGSTYRGVTKDKITVVVFYPKYPDGTQQVLAANNLAMTPEKGAEVHELIEKFFNKHYELRPVGRHPVLADEFFINNSPYLWSQVIQGYRWADMGADFYCKRMHGKNATLSGDPQMQLKKRKLAIISSEAPESLNVAKRRMTQVTGGMCGSKNDGTTLYTYSADPAIAEDQRVALVTKLRDDGMTTLWGASVCTEGDQQRYFPEIYTTEVFDDDFVGRVRGATCGATQMNQVFGIGLFPRGSPVREKEWYKALQDAQPGYEGPYLAEGPFQGMAFLARLIQYAGPTLTPQNVLIGSRKTPQIGGWKIANPWPGWKCCNPFTVEYNIGVDANSYSAKNDFRQIYWSNTERSEGDGVQGAWVGVDGSKRYRKGEMTRGEPKQP